MALLSNISDQISKAARRLSMTSSTTTNNNLFDSHESISAQINHKKKRQGASATAQWCGDCGDDENEDNNNDELTAPFVAQPHLLQQRHHLSPTTSPPKSSIASSHPHLQKQQQHQGHSPSTTFISSPDNVPSERIQTTATRNHKHSDVHNDLVGTSANYEKSKYKDRDPVERNRDRAMDKVKVGKQTVSEMVQALELAHRPSSAPLIAPHSPASLAKLPQRSTTSHDSVLPDASPTCTTTNTTATKGGRQRDAFNSASSPSTPAFPIPEISPIHNGSHNSNAVLSHPSKDVSLCRQDPISPQAAHQIHPHPGAPSTSLSPPGAAYTDLWTPITRREKEKGAARRAVKEDKNKKAQKDDAVDGRRPISPTVAQSKDSTHSGKGHTPARKQQLQQKAGNKNSHAASAVGANVSSISLSRGEHPFHPPHPQHGPVSRGKELANAGRPTSPMDYMPLPSSLPRPLVGAYHGFVAPAAEDELATEDEVASEGDDDGSSLQMEDFYFSGQGAGAVDMVDYEMDDMDIFLGPTNKSTLDISKIKHANHPISLGAAQEVLLQHPGGEGLSKISQLSALERLQIRQRRATQEQQRLADQVLPPTTAEEKRAISGMLPTREMAIESIPALQQHQLYRHREEALMSPVSPPRPPERPFSPTPPSIASQQSAPQPDAGAHDQSNPVDSDSAKLDQLLSSIPGPNRPKLPTQLEWQRNLQQLIQQQHEDTQLSSKASRRQSQPTPREAQQLQRQQQQQVQGGHLKQSKKPYKLNANGGLAWSLAHLEGGDSEDEDSKSRRHSMPEMLPPHLKSSPQLHQPQQFSATPEPGQPHARKNERLNFAQGVGVVRDNGNNQNKRRSGLEWVLQPDLADGQARSRPGSGIEGTAYPSQNPGPGSDGRPRSSASKSTLSEKDALDQAFENMLISLSISEAAREKLHQLPKDHKWAMVQANDTHPALYDTPDTLPPTYFIEALQSYIPSTSTRPGTTVSGKDNQVNSKVKQSRRHSSSASTSSALSAHDAILQNRKRSNSTTMGSSMQIAGAQSFSSSPPRPLAQSISQLLGGTKSEKKVLEEREQVLQKLRILIRNGSVRWSKEFFRVGGASALLEFSNYIACSEETKYGQKERLLYQSIQCIKSMVASEEGAVALRMESQFFLLLRKLVLLDYTLSSPSVLIKDKQGRPQSPAFSRPMSPTAMFYSTNNNSSSKLNLRPTSPTPWGQPMGRTRSRSGSIPKPLSTLSLIPVGGSKVNLHAGTAINSDKRRSSSGQQQQQGPPVVMAEMLLSGLSNIQGALSILLTLLTKFPELKEAVLRETVANPGGSNVRSKSNVPHGAPHHSQHPISTEASSAGQVRRGSLTTSGSALFSHLSYTEWVAHLNKMIQICERDQQARQELKVQHQQALEAYRPRSPVSANGYFYQRRRQTTGAECSGKTAALLGFSHGGSPPGVVGGGGGLNKILGLRRATSPSPTASTPPSSPSSTMFPWENRRRRNSATTEDGLRVLGDVATLAASAAAAGAASVGSDQVGEGRELLACLMLHLDLVKIFIQDMGGPSSLSLGFAKSVKDGRIDESLERLKSYLDATQTFTVMIQETLQLIALVPPHTTRMNASSLIRNHPEHSQIPMPMPLSSPPLDKRRHPSDDTQLHSHHHGHQHSASTTAILSSPSPSPTHIDPTHRQYSSAGSHGDSDVSGPTKTRKAARAQSPQGVAVRPDSPNNHARKDTKTKKPAVATKLAVRPQSKEPSASPRQTPSRLATRGSTAQQPTSRNTPSPLGRRMHDERGEDKTEEQTLALSSTPSPSSPTSPRSPKTPSDVSRRPSRQSGHRHSSSGSTSSVLPVPVKSPRRLSVDTTAKGPQADQPPSSVSVERKHSVASSRLSSASQSHTKGSSDNGGGNNRSQHPRRGSSNNSSSSNSNVIPADNRGDVASVPEKNPARRLGRLNSVSEGGSLELAERSKVKDARVTTSKAVENHDQFASQTTSTSNVTRVPSRATSPILTSSRPLSPAATTAAATVGGMSRSPTMRDLDQYALPPSTNAADAGAESEAMPLRSPKPRSRAASPVSGSGDPRPMMLRPRYQQHLQSLSEASSAGSTSLGSSDGGHFRGQSLLFQEPSTDSSILSTGSSSGDTKEHQVPEKSGLQGLHKQEKQRVVASKGSDDHQEQGAVVELLAVGDVPTHSLTSLEGKPLPPPPALETSTVESSATTATTTAKNSAITVAISSIMGSTQSVPKALTGDVTLKKDSIELTENKADEGDNDDEKAPPIDFDAQIHDNVRRLAASSSSSNLFHGSSRLSSSSPSMTESAAGIHRSKTPTNMPYTSKQQAPHNHQFLRSSTSSQLLTTSSSSSSRTPNARSASRPTSLYATSSSFSTSQQQLLLSARSDTDPKILSAPIIVPEDMTRVHAQYLQSQLSQIVLPPLEDSRVKTTKKHMGQEQDLSPIDQDLLHAPSNRSSFASSGSISSGSSSGGGNSGSGHQAEGRKKSTITTTAPATALSDRIRLFERV
ncbi:hypothetical protein BGZ73_002934 [Actinomortierella ambigua]|nr:hypothetical protein BGZ73_002934 [Actinomortierella ambigua]